MSGYLRFSVADLSRDMPIMLNAREDAFALLETDPGLIDPDHQGLRRVLAEFERKDALTG